MSAPEQAPARGVWDAEASVGDRLRERNDGIGGGDTDRVERRHRDRHHHQRRVQDAAREQAPAIESRGHPAEALLAALGKDRFTSQTFADRVGAMRRPTIRHGPWAAQRRHLEDDNRHGMGAFMTVNHTDLLGRTAAHVTEVAAYFADFDGVELPSSWPQPPTAIVESSEDRFHVYWSVLNAPLVTFSHVQKHLAALFGSDPKVSDLPRVMRLPGLVHAKGEPFVSRLVLVEPANVVEHGDFVDAFDVPPVQSTARQEARPAPGGGRLKRYVWSAVEGEHDAVAAATEGDRNTTLLRAAVRLGGLVGAGMLGEDDARDALLVAAGTCGLPDHESRRTVSSGLRYGISRPRQLDQEPSS